MSRAFMLRAAAMAVALPIVAGAQASPGEGGTYLIRGGTVITGTGERLANTSVLIRDGRIAQIGAGITATGARVIDASGKFVYPGMINSYTGLGLEEIGGVQTMTFRSELGAFNPAIRAAAGINAESDVLGVTRMGGVTSVLSAPTGGSISGQASLINTAGWTVEDLVIRKEAAMVINLPGGGGGGGRGGRGGGGGGATGDLNGFMKAAQEYDARRAGGSTHVDLSYEAMRPLLHKEIPAMIAANGEQAIRQAVEFGDTWGVKVVIIGGADAWRVRTLLAQKNVPVVLSSLQQAPAFNQPYDAVYAQPGLLAEAGVKIAFSTGGDANARHVWEHAALAEAYGLAPDAALKAVTIWPAEIWGVDKEIGSIAQGKMANLLVTTGDPLDLRTQLTQIFIKGRLVPADDRQSRLYQKYKARPKPPV